MSRSISTTLILVAAFGLSACGGDSGDGSTGPSRPDVTGTYEGTWTIEINDLDEQGELSATCPGSVTISEQSQGSITGSFEIAADGACGSSITESFEGSVQSDGTVTFGSGFQFSQFFGCEFLSGDQRFEGMVTDGTLEADATGEYDCSDETEDTDRTETTLGFEGS